MSLNIRHLTQASMPLRALGPKDDAPWLKGCRIIVSINRAAVETLAASGIRYPEPVRLRTTVGNVPPFPPGLRKTPEHQVERPLQTYGRVSQAAPAKLAGTGDGRNVCRTGQIEGAGQRILRAGRFLVRTGCYRCPRRPHRLPRRRRHR